MSICPRSIRWILNYRLVKAQKSSLSATLALDGHSSRTWRWTREQSFYIDIYGWEVWLRDSQRSSGYKMKKKN